MAECFSVRASTEDNFAVTQFAPRNPNLSQASGESHSNWRLIGNCTLRGRIEEVIQREAEMYVADPACQDAKAQRLARNNADSDTESLCFPKPFQDQFAVVTPFQDLSKPKELSNLKLLTQMCSPQHQDGLRLKDENNPLWKHCLVEHNGQPAEFSMEQTNVFGSCLVRQVNEAVRIEMSKADCVMNSKSEFHQAPLVRVVPVIGLVEEQGAGVDPRLPGGGGGAVGQGQGRGRGRGRRPGN